tara:strand:+ start:326 stop:739 length:414 start_codon:yes stop_codon:yes gene_type:complete
LTYPDPRDSDKKIMQTLKVQLAQLEELQSKYASFPYKGAINPWIVECLNQGSEVDALWFKQCLITFIPKTCGGIFNIAVFCSNSKRFLVDRTLYLSPFLEKNFGVFSLDELHSIIRCAPDDLKPIANEIEKELSSFM